MVICGSWVRAAAGPTHRSGSCLTLAGVIVAVSLVLVARAAAQDQDSAGAPMLRVETGMHGAVINRLALVDEGRALITVSDDKTARSWSLPEGTAQAVWRPPIGSGDAGALFAVAAHDDTVVLGGRSAGLAGTGTSLYVVDRRSGQMRGSIGGFADAIAALAFSADGHYLAVGQQGRGGLTVLDLGAHKLAAQDRGYGDTIEWVAFAADGRLATSAADGKIRLYGADFKPIGEARLPGTQRPWGLAFSPDGKRLAVGSLDGAAIRLFSSDRLRLLSTLDGAAGATGALSVVAWSADGEMLAAAGTYKDSHDSRLVRFWRLEARGETAAEDVGVADDTVTDLAFLPDGVVVFISAEPSFGIVGSDGKIRLRRGADHGDFRDAGQNGFRVSRDAAIVDFPSRRVGGQRFRFDLVEGSLATDPPPREELKAPIQEDGKLKLADWRNSAAPKLNGRAIALESGERVRSAAILPGAATVALGTDFYLRLIRASGGEAWRQIVPAPAWGVNASADGRYVLAALGDGTIRWYAAADGRDVMNLFVDPSDGRWVVWVPEGFFDHSHEAGAAGGETLVGYHLNRGPNKAAEFVEIGQLYNLFYRRDLVLGKFRGGAVAERTLRGQLDRIGDVRTVLKGGLPPHLELIEACARKAGADACPPGAGLKSNSPDGRRLIVPSGGGELFARYRLEDRGGGLGRVIVRRNGAVIAGARAVESVDAGQRTETVVLPLDPAGNEIRFATESENAAIQSRGLDDLVVEAQPAQSAAVPGTAIPAAETQLFVVSIGVSAYRQEEFRLANAANDARGVADLFSKPSPPVYATAHVTTLLDEDATAPKIAGALTEVAARARPQDIIVIFLSGHGEAVDGKYFFAPVDFATRHPELLKEAKSADEHRQAEILDRLFREDGFGEAQLLPLLEKIQGNLLLVLDTCYSATLATTDAVAQKARNETVARGVGHEIGRFILAGARSLALDSSGKDEGAGAEAHGLFTTYLLKGLNGDADLQHDGRINVAELLMFTKSRVHDESRKLNLEQEPFYYFSGSNFFALRAVAINP